MAWAPEGRAEGTLVVSVALTGAGSGIPRDYITTYRFNTTTGQIMAFSSEPGTGPFEDDFADSAIYFPQGIHNLIPPLHTAIEHNLTGGDARIWALLGPQWPLRFSEAPTSWGSATFSGNRTGGHWTGSLAGPCEAKCTPSGRQELRITMHGTAEALLPHDVVASTSDHGQVFALIAEQVASDGTAEPHIEEPSRYAVDLLDCRLPPCGAETEDRLSLERGSAALADSPQWTLWSMSNPDWQPFGFVLVPDRSPEAVLGQPGAATGPRWSFFFFSPQDSAQFNVEFAEGRPIVTQADAGGVAHDFTGPPRYPMATVATDAALLEALQDAEVGIEAIRSIHYTPQDPGFYPAIDRQHLITVLIEETDVESVTISAVTGNVVKVVQAD